MISIHLVQSSTLPTELSKEHRCGWGIKGEYMQMVIKICSVPWKNTVVVDIFPAKRKVNKKEKDPFEPNPSALPTELSKGLPHRADFKV